MQQLPAATANDASAAEDRRFGFGESWKSFLARLDDADIAEAEKSLQRLVGRQRFDSMRFLDIGSGSGSLSARRLGAVVVSFDHDPQSVECTAMLRARFFPDDPNWRVERGSILDRDYLTKLGRFDIVCSWGVLHHTGAMRSAIEIAARLVMPGSMFVVALYRKTALCWFWALEKRCYCRASSRTQSIARGLYVTLMRSAFVLTGRDFAAYVSSYRSNRGMDFVHDVHDWLGGCPYESIRPADVAKDLRALGFHEVRTKVHPASIGLFGSGCDEYVYRRVAD